MPHAKPDNPIRPRSFPLGALGLLALLLVPPRLHAQPVSVDAIGDPLPPGAVARLGTVRLTHPGGVAALAFAADGKTLATGGPDRSVRVWDVSTGREVRRFLGHKEAITAVAFLRDGKTLVSGSKEGGIFLWDLATGEKRRGVFHLQEQLGDLAVSPDGKLFASAGGRFLALWEAPSGRFVRAWQVGAVQRAAFSPDGKEIALTGWAGHASVHDVATGGQVRNFLGTPGGDGAMVCVAWAGKVAAAADTRGKLHVYDAATAKTLRSLPGGVVATAPSIALSSDGKLLACSGDGQGASLLVYDTDTGRERWRRHDPVLPAELAFSPDGKLLATAAADGKIRLWHADGGKPLHSFPGHEGPVVRLALPRDGKTVVTAGADGTVRVWDRATGKERRRPITGWGVLESLTLTPDGKVLAAHGPSSPPCLFDLTWNVESRREAVIKDFPKGKLIALSPDGTLYAVYEAAEVIVYQRATGRRVDRRQFVTTSYATIVVSPDSKLFAAVWGERDFHVRDLFIDRDLLASRDGAVEVRRALAFSPDSKFIASASDKRGVEVWDIARKTRSRLPADKQEPCHTVAFSADGKWLAWDGPDGTVRLGDPATGKERLRLRGHDGAVTGVAFTADGRFLVSSGGDGTALVWDLPALLRDGQPGAKEAIAEKPKPAVPPKDFHGDPLPQDAVARLGTVRWRLPGGAQVVAFTPDGKGVVVKPNGLQPGSLHILEMATGKERTRLKGVEYGLGSLSSATRGNLLAVGLGGRLDLWEMPAGRLLRQIDADQSQLAIAIAPDGKTVATAGNASAPGKTHPVRLWDVGTGRLLATLDGHATGIYALAFSADGKQLLSASPEMRWGKQGGGVDVVPGSIRVWDVPGRKLLAQHANTSYGVVFAPDGRAWAYQGQDNLLHLVEAAGGKELARIPIQGSVFTFSPDGKLLATAGYLQALRLWDAATGKEVRRLEGQLGKTYPALLFSPDGKTLACGGQSNWGATGAPARLWDVASGKEIRSYAVHQDDVACAAHTPDGKTVVSGGKDGSLFLWDAATGKALHRLADHDGGVTAVAFARDGRLLASGGNDGAVRLWNVADGKVVRQLDGPGGPILALTFSADGKAVWACAAKGKAQGWATADGKSVRQFGCKAEALHTAAFSPDGSMLASVPGFQGEFSGTATVRVFRVASGKEAVTLDLKKQVTQRDDNGLIGLHCWAITFSADGRLLATSESIQTQGLRVILGNHTVRVWELATGKQVLQATGLGVMTRRLAFSPDGRLLAHGHGRMQGWGQGSEQTLVLRDISAAADLQQVVTDKGEVMCMHSGVQLRQFQGHAGDLTCVAFAPDGKTLLTAGGDGTLVAWKVAAFAPPAPGPQRVDLPAKELQTLWERLAGSDAALGHQAVGRLALAPEAVVPFLKERLKPAPGADPKRVALLIAALEEKNFGVRQKAFNELAGYAEQVEDALRKALPEQRSLEAQRRIQQLLDRIDSAGLSPEHLRTLRALTLLERIATPEARRVLEALAAGAPTRLTREARASLERCP
jgi:WD40 repeat protein